MTLWIAFGILIIACLALDLGVFQRKAHEPSAREALVWTGVWIGLSLLFSGVVYFAYREGWMVNQDQLSPGMAVTKYLTGYLIEKSLSIDNIFVIALIFKYFEIPPKYQHKVLFWGILGAVVFRGLLILIGVALIHRFEWIMFVFAAILLVSAWRMWRSEGEATSLEDNLAFRLVKKVFHVTRHYSEGSFFTRRDGRLAITPLFVALMVVELTDVMFAFDSIPAIFGITTDPFLVFTSNIFAILGLRALYFVLASLIGRFRHLRTALTFVLFFVGVKIIVAQFVEIPEWLSLGAILLALAAGIGFSLWKRESRQIKADGSA